MKPTQPLHPPGEGREEQNQRSQHKVASHYDDPSNGEKSPPAPSQTTATKSRSEDEWRTVQKRMWEQQICVSKWLNWITAAAAGTGLGGLLILYWTLGATSTAANAAKTQPQAAIDALHSQRANVTLGLASGSLADYVPPAGTSNIILHFRNTGPQSAPNALINAFSDLPPNEKGEFHHLYRARAFYKGKPAGVVGFGGFSIGSESRYDYPLDPKWVPNVNQWHNIVSGKYSPFRIDGTIEYCDSWGTWHCEDFSVEYNPTLLSSLGAWG